jgi:hypothetical protein
MTKGTRIILFLFATFCGVVTTAQGINTATPCAETSNKIMEQVSTPGVLFDSSFLKRAKLIEPEKPLRTDDPRYKDVVASRFSVDGQHYDFPLVTQDICHDEVVIAKGRLEIRWVSIYKKGGRVVGFEFMGVPETYEHGAWNSHGIDTVVSVYDRDGKGVFDHILFAKSLFFLIPELVK